MKKITKAKSILRAFTGERCVTESIHNMRMEICNGCEFNSKNIPKDKMSLLDKMRQATIEAPFCVICSCQIYEKTSQKTEECGLADRGENPKWNRIKVELEGRHHLDLENLSEDKINIDLSKNNKYFKIKVGDIKSTLSFTVKLITKQKDKFNLKYIKPGCSSCITIDYTEQEKDYTIVAELNTNLLDIGEFEKNIWVGYTSGQKDYEVSIKIKGKKIK